MAMYHFKYGKTKLSLDIDAAQVAGELKISDKPILNDPVAAIQQALRAPIASAPLAELVKPGETVTLLVNDATRVANSDVFLPVLLDELNIAGIPDKDITILFALGTHHPLSHGEMTELVGEAVAKRIAMYNSDAKIKDDFISVGTTSFGTPVAFHKRAVNADHIICTGSIVYHFFAGFGGGRKALFPGVAAHETIRHNHSFMLHPNAGLGRLKGNPVYDDQVEGTEMRRPTFLLNVVLNEKKEFLGIFAGDYIEAHLAGCQFVESIYGAPLQKPADLVIATCGGYPKDINVYQMQKTMDNAWLAVREGGVIILLAECIEGVGSDMMIEWMKKYQTPERIEAEVRKNFVIGGHKAYAVTRLMKKATFILVSALPPDLARLLLFTPAADLDEAVEVAHRLLGPKPSTLLMPQGGLTAPVLTDKK